MNEFLYKGVFGKQITLSKIVADVMNAKSDNVKIIFNSPGGDALEGLAIYEFLKGCGKNITTESREECSSAASLAFMAGSKRLYGCPIMIHNPFSAPEGDADWLQETADYVRDIESKYVDVYVKETGIPEATIKEFMKRETYIKQAEAVKMGFCSGIAKAVKDTTGRAVAYIDNSKFKKMAKEEKKAGFWARFMANAKPAVNSFAETSDEGVEVIVEGRDEFSTIEVGDLASPDGVHTFGERGTLVIENGMVAQILPAVPSELEPIMEEMAEEIGRLQRENEELRSQSGKITDEDKAAIAFVKASGGVQNLVTRSSKTFNFRQHNQKETKEQKSAKSQHDEYVKAKAARIEAMKEKFSKK